MWLRELPLDMALPAEFGHVRVVHAGMVPGVAVADQRREDLITIRSLLPNGTGSALPGPRGSASWAAFWRGPEHLVFGHDARRKLVAVSGRQRRDLYPRRYLVQQASKIPTSNLLLKLHLLRHPGYPEKIDSPSHAISGSAFIQWLSHHRSAFIDSSIYRVELLKYREAAYAGCAPFGDLPWSLHECPDDAFYQFQSFLDLIKFRAIINDSNASEAVATAYRSFMRVTRCRSTWRRLVASALARLI
jgi:hypothetical protein